MQPLQPSHQSSLLVDDFRSLIVSRKREVAILEAALEILQTAPRDKRFEDLVRKHNIQFEPSVTESEKQRETLESLPKLETGSQKLVLGDLAVNSDIEFQPASTVEPASQLVGSSNVEKDIVEDVIVDLEPAKPSESQQGRLRNTAQLPLSKVDTTFGKLSLSNFPSQQDPNFERLQKKRRRQELMKVYERNNKIKSLNFGAAAKTAAGGSNPVRFLLNFVDCGFVNGTTSSFCWRLWRSLSWLVRVQGARANCVSLSGNRGMSLPSIL